MISVVTLTIPGREQMLERCKALVAAQTIPVEHVIVSGEGTIGHKRNHGCSIATGDIIMMLDDDDFIVPDFIEHAVKYLANADVTGLNNAYFYEPNVGAWEYKYTGGQPYVFGSAMMFHKRVWERSKFPNISEGEEIGFLTNAGRISPHNYKEGFVAFIHGDNTASHKQLKNMAKIDINIPQNVIKNEQI